MERRQGWLYHDLPAAAQVNFRACKQLPLFFSMVPVIVCILGYLALGVVSAPYDPREVDWNLNTNQQTVNPLEYSGEWEGHVYTPSPENWRFPFYTLILDRFVNGDPTNDDINGTTFEHDVTSNQLRYGGDLSGLVESLDYLQGMGVKVISGMRLSERRKSLTRSKGLYIAGTPFLNLPYKYDAYSVRGRPRT
jgi:alpha-1,3-glucan synthase